MTICWCASEYCRLYGCQAFPKQQMFLSNNTCPLIKPKPLTLTAKDIVEAYKKGLEDGKNIKEEQV